MLYGVEVRVSAVDKNLQCAKGRQGDVSTVCKYITLVLLLE